MRDGPAILIAAGLLASPAWAERAEVYAIVGAKIVTVSGPTLETGTLLLRDGLIVGLGPAVVVPPDARVLDGKGLTLTPGLIDGFGGLGLPAPPARPSSFPTGATPLTPPTPNPLVPQTMALDRLRPAELLRARDAGVTTALVISGEGVLPGQSVLINLAGESREAMVLKQPMALHLHMTTLARQYPSSLMGTVAYVRQALLDAGHYHAEWAAYEASPLGKKRPRYDAALAAWQEVARGRQLLVVTARRENDIRRALELADEFKILVGVAGASHAAPLATLLKTRHVPLFVTVNFDPPGPPGSDSGFGGVSDEQERKDIEEAQKNPGALSQAGVPFALVSGHAPDFLAGVRTAIEKGLPREAALRALTLDAALALGVGDRTGSLEAGKMGNLVAWAGEPLTKEAKVKMVFVDGALYEPEERAEPRPPTRRGEGGP